jgi:hypothetical protein
LEGICLGTRRPDIKCLYTRRPGFIQEHSIAVL